MNICASIGFIKADKVRVDCVITGLYVDYEEGFVVVALDVFTTLVYFRPVIVKILYIVDPLLIVDIIHWKPGTLYTFACHIHYMLIGQCI